MIIMILRRTRQKQAILDYLRSTPAHPAAARIYEAVRQKLPHISLGTVYRNLEKLVESGDIQVLRRSGAQCRYDGNPRPHTHVRCRTCGRVGDVDVGGILPSLAHVRGFRQAGFLIESAAVELSGRCSDCLLSGEK